MRVFCMWVLFLLTEPSYVKAFVLPSRSISCQNSRVHRVAPLASEAAAASATPSDALSNEMPAFKRALTTAGRLIFLIGMCIALPITLLPQRLLYEMKLISKQRKETWAAKTGMFCARWMLRLVPFVKVKATTNASTADPQPCIWVCNHTSMLDVFMLLAVDHRLRGKKRRPIKIVYWQGLESNFVTKLLFTQSGFIPVGMADNGVAPNEYDAKTFKSFLKACKQAFKDGFDVGILPEGQLNPNPHQGLLPLYPGAFGLAKLSKRPIGMLALYGVNHVWPVLDNQEVCGRRVHVRAYPPRYFKDNSEFEETFTQIVEPFGKTGQDVSNWQELLTTSDI